MFPASKQLALDEQAYHVLDRPVTGAGAGSLVAVVACGHTSMYWSVRGLRSGGRASGTVAMDMASSGNMHKSEEKRKLQLHCPTRNNSGIAASFRYNLRGASFLRGMVEPVRSSLVCDGMMKSAVRCRPFYLTR